MKENLRSTRPGWLFLPYLFCSTLSIADSLPPGGTQPTLPNGAHPIVGVWTWTLRNTCSETYNYRSDGVLNVTSGDEIAESSYTIDAVPRASGFYKLVDKVINTNGKPDCGGEPTPIGEVGTTFIRFDSSGTKIVMCMDESMRQCIGPLARRPSS